MKCVNHPETDSTGICNHCGKSVCSDCVVQIKGELYCKDCLAIKAGELKGQEVRSAPLAAILSFIIPGMGQIYNGQIGKGLLIFFTGWLVIPWIIGIFDAYATAKKIQEGKLSFASKPGCLIGFAIMLIVSMVFVFIIGLLAAIAIPNLLRARMMANMSAAVSTIKTISTGIESYRTVNNGQYPADEEQLMLANPPYVPGHYNNKTIQGYSYSINFRPDGYDITARPQDCGSTGIKIFTSIDGGEITAAKCAKTADD